jgi:hypothetical protein
MAAGVHQACSRAPTEGSGISHTFLWFATKTSAKSTWPVRAYGKVVGASVRTVRTVLYRRDAAEERAGPGRLQRYALAADVGRPCICTGPPPTATSLVKVRTKRAFRLAGEQRPVPLEPNRRPSSCKAPLHWPAAGSPSMPASARSTASARAASRPSSVEAAEEKTRCSPSACGSRGPASRVRPAGCGLWAPSPCYTTPAQLHACCRAHRRSCMRWEDLGLWLPSSRLPMGATSTSADHHQLHALHLTCCTSLRRLQQLARRKSVFEPTPASRQERTSVGSCVSSSGCEPPSGTSTSMAAEGLAGVLVCWCWLAAWLKWMPMQALALCAVQEPVRSSHVKRAPRAELDVLIHAASIRWHQGLCPV